MMQMASRTTQSGVWIAHHAACRFGSDVEVKQMPVMERRRLYIHYTFQAAAGQNIHFEK